MTIKSLIQASGKTRANIIAETGISQAYLSLLESGERSVGKRYIGPLASSLGVTPQQLRPDLASLLGAQNEGAAQ